MRIPSGLQLGDDGKTAGQAQVDQMLATSPAIDSINIVVSDGTSGAGSAGSSGRGTPGSHTSSGSFDDRRGGRRTKKSREMSEIEFAKCPVSSSVDSKSVNIQSGSALSAMIESQLAAGGDDDDVLIDAAGDEDEDPRESRYRSRTRSCHAGDDGRAVQAAQAYNLRLAAAGGGEGGSDSPTRDSGGMFPGGTTPKTYNPTKPGTYKLSDKFRCTVHLDHVLSYLERVAPVKSRAISVAGRPRDLSIGARPGPDSDDLGSRRRRTSVNNPSTIVGLSSASYVQLEIDNGKTAAEVTWKAIRSYLEILESYSPRILDELKQSLELTLWLGEEDGSVDDDAPPLAQSHRVAACGIDNFVVKGKAKGALADSKSMDSHRRTASEHSSIVTGGPWWRRILCCVDDDAGTDASSPASAIHRDSVPFAANL